MACETTSGQHAQQDQSVQRYKAVKVTKHCKDKDTKTEIVTLHSLRLIEIGEVSHMANTRLVSRHTCVSIKRGGNSAAKASLFYASGKCGFGRTHKSFR